MITPGPENGPDQSLLSGTHIVCYNGEFMPLEKAALSPTDSGFTHGYGVFTTARIEKGQLLHADAHFRRLAEGARVFRIPFRLGPEEFQTLCEQVVDANNLKQARLRATLTKGPGRDQPAHIREGEETFLITASALNDDLDTLAKPVNLTWANFQKNHLSPLARVKNCNYAEVLIARSIAREKGFDDVIFLNVDGEIAECGIANLFWVKDDIVYTPSIEAGALPGVMRSIILELCREHNIRFQEGLFKADEILQADEIFTTNAVRQICPVPGIENERSAGSSTGPMTEYLFRLYRELVNLELDGHRN